MNKLVYVAINNKGELLTSYSGIEVRSSEPRSSFEYVDVDEQGNTKVYEWMPAVLIITNKD